MHESSCGYRLDQYVHSCMKVVEWVQALESCLSMHESGTLTFIYLQVQLIKGCCEIMNIGGLVYIKGVHTLQEHTLLVWPWGFGTCGGCSESCEIPIA